MSRFTLLRKARGLKPKILHLSKGAVKICLSRFLVRNNLTLHVATHTAQHDPHEGEAEAPNFLEYICPHLKGAHRSPNYIINMDQMPVYHAMLGRTTIDEVGVCTVNMRAPMGSADSKHVTVAAGIVTSGRKVQSMVVFKGECLYLLLNFTDLLY